MRPLGILGACVVLSASLLPACGSREAGCVDLDLDGYGEGCPAGPDCDDTNPLRHVNCDLVPPPDCEATPFATGCPCLPGVAECYPGPADTRDVGPCRAGRSLCIHGHRGLCQGAIVPRPELCSGVDDDCDGRVDEGTLSPCGGCMAGCGGEVWGEGAAPFAPTDALEVTSQGALTLRREPVVVGDVWIANGAEDTVSRLDAASAREVARYFSGGAEPSRVAVDWRGDAWIANRAFDGVGSVTKIASDPARCVDRDGDGLDTSTGSTPVAGDECVLFTREVGGRAGVPRALAVDGHVGPDGGGGGDVWVGLHDEGAVVRLDGETGLERERIETPGFEPYAAGFDPWGTLWMISRDGYLLSVEGVGGATPTVNVREVPLPCYLLYGLDLDREGRIFVTGFGCDRVSTFDPATERWSTLGTPPSVRGAVIDDARELAFVAHTDGRVSQLRVAPLSVEATWELAGLGVVPREAIGIGLDAFGHVWVASTSGAAGGRGVATRLDPATGAVGAQVSVGVGPHTQGDLTGAKRAERFVPSGSASYVFRGCATGDARVSPDTVWQRLHVTADVSPFGRVIVDARHAPTEVELADAPFVRVGVRPDDPSPMTLDLPRGGLVEVRLTLEVDGPLGAPRVRRVGLEESCPGPD